MRQSLAASLVLAMAACGEPAVEPALGPKSAERAQAKAVVPAPTSRCSTPSGVSGSPTTISAAVGLINALPKPVSAACFVESLNRPLALVATASPFSAQPANDSHSPRIFIRNGTLTMVVVPGGMGRNLLEFGEATAEGSSLKGELELPIVDTLTEAAPLDRVQAGKGTTCGTCHDDEAPAASGAGFISEVLIPLPEFEVTVAELQRDASRCGADDNERCDLLRALFDHGDVGAGTLQSGGRLCHG